MDRDAELRLVGELREGDENAFRAAYDLLRARVFTFILRMVQRRAIAEELAQETWLRLAVRARSLQADTHLEAWVFTVARNLCISYWRTRGGEEVFDAPVDETQQVREPGASPERRAAASELRDEMEAALARLPRLYREALLLVGVQGMTPATAAEVCGVSPEAMRKRLERARDVLAATMQEARRRRAPGTSERLR